MMKKFLIYCVPIVVSAMLVLPALADVTVTYSDLTHSWPDLSSDVRDSKAAGSRLLINTMAGTIYNGDPNALTTDGSPPYQLVGENFNDRAVTGTFGLPQEDPTFSTPYGFTLTHIVIAANGGGSDANQPMSLHIYDLNTKPPYPYTGTQTNYNLVGGTGAANTANDAMLPPGDLLSSSATFVYRRNADPNLPHTFVDFNFTGYDSFDLEPNHEYAFEIWPTKGNDPGWYWHRDTSSQNYPYGKCYRVDAPSDYRLLTTQRQAVAAGNRVQVMGVYGIPCDGNAFAPKPRNMQTGILLDTELKWHRGKWCGPGPDSNHVIYLHTDALMVQMRDTAARRARLTDVNFTDVNEPNWKPTITLVPDKWYYWRVDEYNNVKQPGYWGRSTNPTGIWAFKTSGPKASAPNPPSPSGLTEFKPQRAWLSWTKGCYIGSADVDAHQVYFGTNYADVCDATTSTPVIYRGAVTDPCYPLSNLAPDYTLTSGTTYYWRVDEVNAVHGTAKGDVWSFTMPNPAYIVLDDFTYQSDADLQKVWKTGYRLPVKPPMGDSVDHNIVAGSISVQAGVMSLAYDNSYTNYGPWSETAMDYNFVSSTGIDWTLGGAFDAKAIGIQFDGLYTNTLNAVDVNNDKMYLAIEDTSGKVGVAYLDSDPYAAQRDITIESGNIGTRELKFSLPSLTSPNDVNLKSIAKVYIGIGSPRGGFQNQGSGGMGTIEFDNLKVYVQHCNPPASNVSAVAGDLGGPRVGNTNNRFTKADCIVNYNDIFFFTADWLWNEPNKDFTATKVDPGTSDLTVWYKFDEGSGSFIEDSSGNGRHGTLYNYNNPFTWAYSGHDGTGYCLNLEHGYKTWVECPNTVVNTVVDGPETATGQSFTFWLKYNENFFPAHVWSSVLVFFAGAPGTGGAQQIETQLPVPFTPGDQSRPWVRWVNQAINNRETGRQLIRESLISSRWNHYALVYNTADTSMKMYINGVLDNNAAFSDLTAVWDPNTVRIGTRSNQANPATDTALGGGGFWNGRIDDMRLYKKALSEGEVQYLATDGTGKLDLQKVFIEPDDYINTTVTLPTGPTVKIVNFNDFAVQASYWLNQQLWP